MRGDEIFRMLIFGSFACIIAWDIYSRFDAEIGKEREGRSLLQQRYIPVIPGALLPFALLLITVLSICLAGPVMTFRLLLPLFSTLFLQSSLYYALLLPVMPFLRKRISARTCAVLWLLPTYLYYLFNSGMELSAPRWVIHLPGKTIWILLGIWFVGFVAVMVWKITEHLAFRRSILRGAREVYDPVIRGILETEIEGARIKRPKFKLVISPQVQTPVTVGLYKWAMRVVLPEKGYTPEELKLVLRHEIVHIAREDAWAKFFMVFCTALCWFNPLMWIAMRRSAEDIELSCDETVLLDANDKVRKQYGILLLETAANERGFTTCLSASAQAMRYRLTNIIKPQKRRSGAILVGVLLFVLCMTGGYTALAYGSIDGAEAIYGGQDPAVCTFQTIEKEEGRDDPAYTAIDPMALHQYLAGLELAEISGNYAFGDTSMMRAYYGLGKPRTEYALFIDTPRGGIEVILQDRYVVIHEKREQRTYYIPAGIDWAQILQSIELKPWYKD